MWRSVDKGADRKDGRMRADLARYRLLAIVASLLVLAGVSAATVAASSKGSQADKGTIAMMFPNANQPIVVRVLDVAKQEAKKRGYKFIVSDPGNDLNKQVGVINTWIQQKVSAIESVAAEPKVFEKVAAQARKAGIVWVTYAARLKNEDATVTWPHYKGGFLLGQEAGRWISANSANLGGKAKVSLITFEQGDWSRQRRMGIEAGLKSSAAGKYEVVNKQDSLTAPGAQQIVGTVLQAHSDLNVVLCVIDTPCEGAYQGLLKAGHSANDPKLFVGGLDGTPHAFQLIQQGTFYRASAALSLAKIGRAVIDGPADILETHKKRDAIVPYELLTKRTPSKLRAYAADWKAK
jgi:ribose transport system substrate-binding protein